MELWILNPMDVGSSPAASAKEVIMASIPHGELLRLACIYAEQDRRGFIDSYDKDEPEAIEAAEFLAQLVAYRKKRWGITQLEAMLKDMKVVLVSDLMKQTREARRSSVG